MPSITKNQSILLTLFLMAVVAWIIFGCNYSWCSPFEQEIENLKLVAIFEESVNRDDFPIAFSFLTKEAQSKIDYEIFSSTPWRF